MPALSSSNRSQLRAKFEGLYPTDFGVTPAGNGYNLNMLSESLNFDVRTVSSKQIRSDRQVPDIVQVSASCNGGFAFEQQYREYDPLIEGVFQNTYSAYGTNGVGTAIATLTVTSSTVLTAGVAPTTSSAFSNLKKGQWFSIIPDPAASDAIKAYLKGRSFRISLTTATAPTILTLDASTPVSTAILGASLSNCQIASSRMDNGNLMRSFSLEVAHEDITQYRLYKGMIPSKMDLKLNVGEIVTGNFEFIGKDFAIAQATAMGGAPSASKTFTPANATRGVFDILEGGSSVSAVTYIQSAELSIDNSLRAQEAVGVFGLAGVGSGTMQIMGKLSVYFAEHTVYQKLLQGAASSLCIPMLDVDGNGYVYYFPRIKYTAAKVAVGGLDQDNMLEMDFQALPDIAVGSDTLGKSVIVYRVGVAAV